MAWKPPVRLPPFHSITTVLLPHIGNFNSLEPLEIVSDYINPSTIKIKKPKKKKPKTITRMSALLEDHTIAENDTPGGVTISVDEVAPIPLASTKRTYNEDSGLGDDEELQELLAQRRRTALKKRKISRPEDIVQNIRRSGDDENLDASENGGLVIDDTSEFVRALEMSQLEAAPMQKGLLHDEQSPGKMEIEATDNFEDTEMPDDMLMMVEHDKESNEAVPSLDLEDEPIIGGGSLAATLAALKRTGTFPSFLNLTISQVNLEKEQFRVTLQWET